MTACVGNTAGIMQAPRGHHAAHKNKGELIDGFAFFICTAGLIAQSIAQKESPREAG